MTVKISWEITHMHSPSQKAGGRYLPLVQILGPEAFRVGDAIQPSHPLLPPSPPALNLSQHQGLFQ